MIARAIAGHPEILLVDEILDTLPDAESETILRKILAADNSWTILVVTSRPHLQRMLNRVLEIRPSRDHEIDRSLAH